MLIGPDGDAVPMPTPGQLKVQLETLATFKGRIDALLDSLEKSQAGPEHIGLDKLQSGHLGTGFPQAETLTGAYTHVHSQLETFSGLLSDQMQAMQLAVEGARTGYANMDLDQRRKLWDIYDTTSRHYHATEPSTGAQGQGHGTGSLG